MKEEETPTIVAVLLALTAVIVAVIGARAALLGDHGSDVWHQSIREDVKRGAAVFEDSRFVYEEDVTAAFRLAEAGFRAEELRRAAKGEPSVARGILESEATAQDALADSAEQASPAAANPKYSKGPGYDAAQRLADVRAENPELVELDPDATQSEGGERSLESSLLVAATIVVAVAFVLGALSQGFPGWRRRLVPAGFVFAAVGLTAALAVEVAL